MIHRLLAAAVLTVVATHTAHAQEKIYVFLLGGQSNMLGRANIAGNDPLLVNGLDAGGIASNDIIYHHSYRGAQTLADNGFTILAPRPADDDQSGNFGPELTFGRDVRNAISDGHARMIWIASSGFLTTTIAA